MDLPLAPSLQQAVRSSGYSTPTPIQSSAIPHVLEGRDVLGCAQTGTGKTAAFALPILQHLLETPQGARRRGAVRALVLAPTRELAAQIGESFGKYAQGSNLRHLVVFGGVGKEPQIRALKRGVEILVATPGRLLDLMQMGVVSLSSVDHVVLDEADRMLDMGFIHDIKRVMAKIPENRQTLLFSATIPKEIESMAGKFLNRPKRIAVDPVSSTCDPIEQSVYFVESASKSALLVELLQDGEIDRALIFTRTKHGANRLAQKLTKRSIPASAIHGNKSQSARERTLLGLRSGETRVVVATDLASRGLDVKGLSHVVNFDIPNEPENYVHRVGRTGRAGESGIAVSLCAPAERPYLQAIEKLTGRKLIRRSAESYGLPAPSAEDTREDAEVNRRRLSGPPAGRRNQGRNSKGGHARAKTGSGEPRRTSGARDEVAARKPRPGGSPSGPRKKTTAKARPVSHGTAKDPTHAPRGSKPPRRGGRPARARADR
ncbi:MAG: DEAD/DEAH box helicase [Candidatus Binatia bacterium]|nr:DEAD/DEAH box helicase [Candidatus Binatia bacterium]